MATIANVYMMKPVRRLLEQCLGVVAGESLLVLTDTDKAHLAEMFVLVGNEMGAEVTLLVMTPRTRHGDDLPPVVAAAMAAADAIVAPTTFSVNHTAARSKASCAGARLIFIPDACEEIFRDGSLEIDFLGQKRVIDTIARVLDDGSEARVRSRLGTDLRMSIKGKKAVPQSGICTEPGSISPPPCIEVAIAPDEGTLEGTMYVDGAVVPGGVVDVPIVIAFEGGRITKIEGDADAEALEATLAAYEDENIYCAVEMGMGMNPNARIGRASSVEDEAELGTMHIGIGNGVTFGSSIRARGHCDLVMRAADVIVDGTAILENGALMMDGQNGGNGA